MIWQELQDLSYEYQKLNVRNIIDYEKFSMISIIWHSTKIEGCSLNETDSRILIENDITAKGKPLKDHLMLKDHFAAYQYINNEAKLKSKLSLDLIKKTGALVMQNTGALVNTIIGSFNTSEGDLRLAQVYVDKKYFPDFSKVPSLLMQLCESTNNRIDSISGINVLKLAADLHYNFVNIHPFGDGNGRTARLLMNYIQIYHGHPPIKIFTEDRTEYIDSLNETEEKGNPDIFREFIAKQQIKFLKLEIEKFNRKDNGFQLIF